MPNLNSIDEILDKHSCDEYECICRFPEIRLPLKQALSTMLGTVIGENDTRPLIETYKGEPVSADYTRNRLRAEQRSRAQAMGLKV